MKIINKFLYYSKKDDKVVIRNRTLYYLMTLKFENIINGYINVFGEIYDFLINEFVYFLIHIICLIGLILLTLLFIIIYPLQIIVKKSLLFYYRKIKNKNGDKNGNSV